ncbi:GH92 family glycosyl hydrolase [Fulvivirga ligni]|uniref:GH92 family glycosyl hydrolase n=1 Tax=Fulvivirga ligni TaxID=2904246 RepID=UPI001F3D390F|nr:GH92 family glycosyl hydrolase [Fulvivirga ligni]UII21368.1 GH92 family glycosyl hydrolase [Fulvivirga ligni]
MYKLSAFVLLIFLFAQCSDVQPEQTAEIKTANFTQYVDPYIGTGYHGHVFLGANVPFGAVQLGPTNITQGWDWCSGYHYSDSTLIGFAHTHLSGTGIGDLGDIIVLPTTGEVNWTRYDEKAPEKGYMAYYSHDDEKVQPGYYSVWIDKYQVQAELTSTKRVGFHKYNFKDKSTPAHVLIDLDRGIGWDGPVKTHIEQVNDSLVTGYRYSAGWAKDQKIYFALVTSSPITGISFAENGNLINAKDANGKQLKGTLNFGKLEDKELLMKVAISPVSTQNALENMQAELSHWNFDAVKEAANDAWNEELAKIDVSIADDEKMKVFYTSLYHTMIAPSVFQDVNGDYRGADGNNYTDKNFTNYTTYSLWDTYRAAHPLLTLTQRDRVKDMVNSFLKIYQQQGKLPIWHLMGNETDCMVGYSAVPVIADAYFKGIEFDTELAMEAMQASTTRDDYGVKFLKADGYIPADKENESVAKALEYCVSDAAIARMAKALGKNDVYEKYKERSESYKKYFDKETQFMRGVMADGGFRTPFSPFRSNHRSDDYTEGNAWQYTWLVPADVEGLIELFGSEAAFETKLDSLFMVEGDMGEHASADISGLIGQYAHGNEPSHHIAYLYPYIGKPWKTAEKVRYIMDSLYLAKPEGLCGNEDVGQMSAWNVLSSLGFYEVNPFNGQYVLGSPIVNEAHIALNNGKTFNIKATNNSSDNIYIQKVSLNGKEHPQSFITYDEIQKGGDLEIEMGPKPSETWGVKAEDRPKSGE